MVREVKVLPNKTRDERFKAQLINDVDYVALADYLTTTRPTLNGRKTTFMQRTRAHTMVWSTPPRTESARPCELPPGRSVVLRAAFKTLFSITPLPRRGARRDAEGGRPGAFALLGTTPMTPVPPLPPAAADARAARAPTRRNENLPSDSAHHPRPRARVSSCPRGPRSRCREWCR